jgi:hypothetical protein
MENHPKEQISTNLEKKTWAIPELIFIDKKEIESGYKANTPNETSTYRGTT